MSTVRARTIYVGFLAELRVWVGRHTVRHCCPLYSLAAWIHAALAHSASFLCSVSQTKAAIGCEPSEEDQKCGSVCARAHEGGVRARGDEGAGDDALLCWQGHRTRSCPTRPWHARADSAPRGEGGAGSLSRAARARGAQRTYGAHDRRSHTSTTLLSRHRRTPAAATKACTRKLLT